MSRPCARWSAKHGIALSIDRPRGLPRPDHHAPARAALHLADRRWRGAGAGVGRAGGERPAQRRRGGGRAGRAAGAGLSRGPGARPAAAARRGEYRRRRQRHLDRRRRRRCWPSTPDRAMGRSTTGARAAPGSATTGRRAGGGGQGRPWRGWSASPSIASSRSKPPKSLDRGDFNDALGRWAQRRRWRRDADARHGARHRAGGAALSGAGVAMGDLRRRRAQSDVAARHRRGDARQGRDGGRSRLGRRCAGGAGLRLPGGALAARPAAHLSRRRPARRGR